MPAAKTNPEMKRLLLSCLLAAGICFAVQANDGDGWTSLFNGRNLKGWERLGGKAVFKVEDGAIVGVSTKNTPNTFLATKERYGDFILEMEYKVDEGVNSGVQIRSQSRADYQNGRVYGYQFEIDPASPAGNCGVYDEARRGWLYSLENEPQAREAFRHGEWNKLRIEAVGHSLRVWVNGVPTADIVDDADSEGFIALQVHEIGDSDEKAGTTVRWRNIRIKTGDLSSDLTPVSDAIPERNHILNSISPREAAEGWQLLFNGRDLQGWKSLSGGDMTKGWGVENGELVIHAKSGAGDIVTDRMYGSFDLKVDFRITKGANSGIKYFINSNGSVGCEYQILDDENHPDAKMGFNGNRRLGSLYDLIPAQGWQYVDKYGWNTARIVVRGNKVEHWINGHKILEYERGNMMWDTIVSHSKFARVKGFAADSEGYILLQDHNDEVHYRNLKIRILD